MSMVTLTYERRSYNSLVVMLHDVLVENETSVYDLIKLFDQRYPVEHGHDLVGYAKWRCRFIEAVTASTDASLHWVDFNEAMSLLDVDISMQLTNQTKKVDQVEETDFLASSTSVSGPT